MDFLGFLLDFINDRKRSERCGIWVWIFWVFCWILLMIEWEVLWELGMNCLCFVWLGQALIYLMYVCAFVFLRLFMWVWWLKSRHLSRLQTNCKYLLQIILILFVCKHKSLRSNCVCFDVILKCVLLLFICLYWFCLVRNSGFTHTKLASKFLGIGCESLCLQSI